MTKGVRLLTDEQEQEILLAVLKRNQLTDKALARRFGLTRKQISDALAYLRRKIRTNSERSRAQPTA